MPHPTPIAYTTQDKNRGAPTSDKNKREIKNTRTKSVSYTL